MPRPKTKGDAICIRLEQHVDDTYQAICFNKNITPRDMAMKIITDWVVTQTKTSGSAAIAGANLPTSLPSTALVEEFFD